MLLGLLAGCATYRPAVKPDPQVDLPAAFSQTGESIPAAECWWQELGDPRLENLEQAVLADNLTLRMAWSRLDQMAAVARISGAARYPTVDLALSGERQRLGVAQPPPPLGTGSDSSTTLVASLGVGFQVDLWKKTANTRQAGLLDLQATQQDLESTALAVTAAAAELWYSLAAQQATLKLLEDQLAVGEEYLDLVKARFANGLASAMDVYRQELQVETTRSQIPAAETNRDTLAHQLAVLQGKQAKAAITTPPNELPSLPPLPATGVPSEVLRSRPDVRASELRLVAADHRLAVAIAERYPSFSISAAAGGQAESFSKLLDQWFVNLAGNLLAPIVDGGRRRAEAERNRAVVEERLTAWQSSLLNAGLEVEDTLSRERGLRRSSTIIDSELELASATLERSRALYVNGLTDYLNVLTSLQSLQGLQRAAIGNHLELLVNRIRLHLALGGSTAVRRPGLACISHQPSTAVGDAPHPAPLSRLWMFDVLSSTPAHPSGRKHRCARHLANIATKPGEKCGQETLSTTEEQV